MKARPIIAIALAFAAMSLAACNASVSVGEKPAMSEQEAEKQTEARLAQEYGEVPPVDCPGKLSGEKGSQMNCVMGPDGKGTYYDVRLTTDRLQGDQIDFTINILGPTQASN